MRANGAYIAPCAGLDSDGVILVGAKRMGIVRGKPGSSQDGCSRRAVVVEREHACARVIRRSVVNSRYKIRA